MAALLAVAGCLVATLSPAEATSAAASSRQLEITGYATASTCTPSTVARQARGITTVGDDGVSVAATGARVFRPSHVVLAIEAAARAHGLRAELVVDNFGVRTFSPSIAATQLGSAALRTKVAGAIAAMAATDGFDGVTVDFESLDRKDAAGLAAFLGLLRADLAGTLSLSVDVEASTTPRNYEADGYDLRAIAAVATTVVLMTYDEHGPWSGPGPIGGLPWQRRALSALLTLVPAHKVELGVAGYGYTWPAAPRTHDGVTVTDARAEQLVAKADAPARWSPVQGEWTARLSNGTTLWWSDTRSYAERVQLASAHHLAGLAIWQLSSIGQLPSR